MTPDGSFTVKPVPHRHLTLEVRWRRMWTLRAVALVWRVALGLTGWLLGLNRLQMREDSGRWRTLPDRLHAELASTLSWEEDA
jgi:hypothetical protein